MNIVVSILLLPMFCCNKTHTTRSNVKHQLKLPEKFDADYILKRGAKTRKQWLEYFDQIKLLTINWLLLNVDNSILSVPNLRH